MPEEIDEKDRDIINNVPNAVDSIDLSKEVPVQAEIDIDLKEKLKQEKTKINSRSSAYLGDIINTAKEQPGGGSTNKDDVKQRLLADSQPLSSAVTNANDAEDNASTADLMIEIADWILVAIIHWFSMADSDKEYQTGSDKKRVLKKYLAKFLEKKQAKYPVEFFLVMAFLSTYFISARKAYQDRKVNEPIKKAREIAKRSVPSNGSEKKKRKLSDVNVAA